MEKLGLLVSSIMLMMASCTTQQTVKYTVASSQADCIGVAPQKCLQVKVGDQTDWTFFYSGIEGFNYEPGYEYVLEVKEDKVENVPADASSVKYTLVKEVSKVKKESENMLPGIPIAAKFSWTGKVVSIEGNDIGVGAAKGKFPVVVVKLEVTSTGGMDIPFKEGDTIHCELISETSVKPEIGTEYAFKAKNAHPAHALGVYMLDTDVLDLVN